MRSTWFQFFTTLALYTSGTVHASGSKLDNEKFVRIFDEYVKEIDRLDADGLIPRNNRSKSWETVKQTLRMDMTKAKTSFDVGQVFVHLDASYTNLHAHLDLNDEYNLNKVGYLRLGVSFYPETVAVSGGVPQYRLGSVKKDLFLGIEADDRPNVGDQLIAINERPIQLWADENFEFCKYPLRSQCEFEFFHNFRDEILSWDRRQPLVIEVKRDGRHRKFNIPVVINPSSKSSQTHANVIPDLPCGVEASRYPNFKIAYKGYNACVFVAAEHPGIAVLRIRNFVYRDLPVSVKIKNVHEEAAEFLKNYWSTNLKHLNALIIDVASNRGGDSITSWAALFIPIPFQDQWVQFKKIAELSDPHWQSLSFYEDQGKFRIFRKWKQDGTWDKVKFGDFLPPMPQFCVTDEGDCLKEKWPSKQTGFKGQYIVFSNHNCFSSCSGFVWTMKNYLKDRLTFVGIPDSGDTTYARAFIEGKLTSAPPHFLISLTPRKTGTRAEVDTKAIAKQAVSISRTTDETGKVLSGIPQQMDYYVSQNWDEDENDWVARLLKTTLSKIFPELKKSGDKELR